MPLTDLGSQFKNSLPSSSIPAYTYWRSFAFDMASESSSHMRTTRFTYQAEFDFSKTENLHFRESISSATFTAYGYYWNLEYYPRGDNHKHNQSEVSLYLNLESEVEEIAVESSFALLDKRGKFITIHNPAVDIFTVKDTSWGYPTFLSRDKIKKLCCVNDIVVISCSIRVLNPYPPLLTPPKIVEDYPGGLCEHIENLWQKGENSDVNFEVEGEKISAHRLILAARSPVFAAQLFGPMAEVKKKHIKIDEMKATVFKALLHFIYTDQLVIDESTDEESEETLSIELLQGLFVAADRYSLDKLTSLCEEQLEKNLSVDTVVTTLLLADRHSSDWLKEKCLDFASSPDNFSEVALTEGYLSIMPQTPSLVAELSEKVKGSSHIAKKQKTA